VWDPRNGTCHWFGSEPEGSQQTLAVTDLANRRLASLSDDQTQRIWDPARGDCPRVIERPDLLRFPREPGRGGQGGALGQLQLHRSPVAGGLDARLGLGALVKVADRERGHGDSRRH
jgi:hypothetical protein